MVAVLLQHWKHCSLDSKSPDSSQLLCPFSFRHFTSSPITLKVSWGFTHVTFMSEPCIIGIVQYKKSQIAKSSLAMLICRYANSHSAYLLWIKCPDAIIIYHCCVISRRSDWTIYMLLWFVICGSSRMFQKPVLFTPERLRPSHVRRLRLSGCGFDTPPPHPHWRRTSRGDF